MTATIYHLISTPLPGYHPYYSIPGKAKKQKRISPSILFLPFPVIRNPDFYVSLYVSNPYPL